MTWGWCDDVLGLTVCLQSVKKASETGRNYPTQHWIKMDDVLETSAERMKGKKCRSTMLKVRFSFENCLGFSHAFCSQQRRDEYLSEAEKEAESYQKTHTRSITPWTFSETTKLPLHKRSQRYRMEREREIVRERQGLTPNSGLSIVGLDAWWSIGIRIADLWMKQNLAAGSEYKMRVSRDLKTRTDLLSFRQNEVTKSFPLCNQNWLMTFVWRMFPLSLKQKGERRNPDISRGLSENRHVVKGFTFWCSEFWGYHGRLRWKSNTNVT